MHLISINSKTQNTLPPISNHTHQYKISILNEQTSFYHLYQILLLSLLFSLYSLLIKFSQPKNSSSSHNKQSHFDVLNYNTACFYPYHLHCNANQKDYHISNVQIHFLPQLLLPLLLVASNLVCFLKTEHLTVFPRSTIYSHSEFMMKL